ncbi:hypothetical protein GCK72_008204 [Caenorhabditis remanei]|uniref:Uncharacterized protein n=2 Tax=Caenorhabditis remanei TaxID=31234 RepID=E3MNY2_CAERE|nr:hypothetical protein GCK72_008204 [Caenorhabditis remanei]EFP06205.1 hypothetical protein CRE_06748 [Caenorhabditis remanei]KAF1759959.1 hypothetical protein GCK72_008204 [Caenorhabditis remanei]
MSETPKKDGKSEDYKKAVAKQRRLKKLRKMKIKDRAGDVVVSDISDVEVQGDGEEESQDAWLNDLLKADGDGGVATNSPDTVGASLHSMETTEESLASKICAFTSENSALLGVGLVTVALTIFARLRK